MNLFSFDFPHAGTLRSAHQRSSMVVFDAVMRQGRLAWAGVDASGRVTSRNVPADLRARLHKQERGLRRIEAFALHPTDPNGYIVVDTNGVFARGMPSDLVAELRRFKRPKRHRIQAIALGTPRFGRTPWVFVAGDRDVKVRSSNAPATLIEYLRMLTQTHPSAPRPKLTCIRLAGRFGWAIAVGGDLHDYKCGRMFSLRARSLKRSAIAVDQFGLWSSNSGGLTGLETRFAILTKGVRPSPSNPVQLTLGGGIDEANLLRRLELARVPGCAIAVVTGNRVTWSGGLGTASGRNIPVDGDTLFSVASVSKVIAAIAVLRLIEMRLLSLDSRVVDRLGDFELRPAWFVDRSSLGHFSTLPNVRHLLNHRSGVRTGGYWGAPLGTPEKSVIELLEGFNGPRAEMVSAPAGKVAAYGGANFTLLEQIVELKAKMPFRRFVREQVLDPIGMPKTTLSTFSRTRPPEPWARGHDGRGRMLPGGRKVYPQAAAAGLWTTANEMARVLIMLNQGGVIDGRRVLQASTVDQMLRTVTADAPFTHGLRCSVRPRTHPRFGYGHVGSQGGFRAAIRGGPNLQSGVVVLTNGSNRSLVITIANIAISAHHGALVYSHS